LALPKRQLGLVISYAYLLHRERRAGREEGVKDRPLEIEPEVTLYGRRYFERLSDNDILARLVALNQERVKEEAAGHVRWLRPDYRIPRFGSARDKLALTGGAMREPAAAQPAGPKPSFPASELEQTAAVLSVLTQVSEPVSATAPAVRFRQGRRVLPQVEAVLAALVRVGGLVHSPDGGRSFLPRRAA
jgi:hypothetical protein